ncbi:MAG: DUF1361 domain-containing protein [Pseudarcicella sp.]|nr:DUF1361 domain-containing protein [Pseudarcicella sp.]
MRIILKEDWKFSFLMWNLFLAWTPFFFTHMVEKVRSSFGKFTFCILAILFFPNSPYMITDLLHLKLYQQNIIWFDSLLIFSFAFTGLLIGLFSLKKGHHLLKIHTKTSFSWILILTTTFLSGFGIYLGRYCRLNSWDLFQRPLWFIGRVLYQFNNPLMYKMTLTFGFIIIAFYYIFHSLFNPNEKDIYSKFE